MTNNNIPAAGTPVRVMTDGVDPVPAGIGGMVVGPVEGNPTSVWVRFDWDVAGNHIKVIHISELGDLVQTVVGQRIAGET